MIIESLLDQDLYKFTMMQVVLHQFPGTEVEYQFRCRNEGIVFSKEVVDRINQEIDHLCTLMFQPDEIEYLNTFRFFKKDFVNFLKIFRLQREFIKVSLENGTLSITITGPWLHTIMFEVFVLAIVNECYFSEKFQKWRLETKDPEVNPACTAYGILRLVDKIEFCNQMPNGFCFAEFGTRRRFSKEFQNIVIDSFVNPHSIVDPLGEVHETFDISRMIGTSNLYFAKKYSIMAVRTMAHEFIQAGQGLNGVRISNSQKYMLEAWVQEYRGDLGIALTDTLGLDAFLVDFDLYFAKLFDGVRQDSGDPYEVGEKIIKHYEKLRIDPKTKMILFSDGLNIPKALALFKHFNGRIKVGFGIGTDLVNDSGFTPLNIVIKMTRCNGHPVAKISDSSGKCMCTDDEYITYLKKVIEQKIKGV